MNPSLYRIGTLIYVLLISHHAQAQPMVVTPGSLASYTYFPPAATTGGGGSTGGGEQDSLQRCLWAPDTGDKTAQVYDDFGYDKEVKLYYRMVGGDGGGFVNGGGGGSSAILKNGVPAVVANGGDGGSAAQEKAGFIPIKKGDVLRFITGGGGGGGYWTSTMSIGGGGGAGYFGGGGGASHYASAASTTTGVNGKGGSASGGAGGYAAGMLAGTAGGWLVGGVSTFASGSSAPVGSFNDVYGTSFSNYMGWYDTQVTFDPGALRWPATGVRQGSPMGDPGWFRVIAGSGGALGNGGGGTFETWGYAGIVSTSWPDLGIYARSPCSYNCSGKLVGAQLASYPRHTEEMKLTRQIFTNQSELRYQFPGASLGGQIITMYQAPTCGFLK
ncbi:hypothetical protein [Xylophilus sp. ASV27]|uniref:hypothetical protein n=1 Tax=Xylophilus sp. ASV27 TaxID=2795129 RepID=UPI0018EAAA4C|nr:hypothetical protein [Xylophilus sp. ASV27]